MTDAERDESWRLHKEGMGYKKIGDQLSVPWPTVATWIKKRKDAEPVVSEAELNRIDWEGVKYLGKKVTETTLSAFERVYYRKMPEPRGDWPVMHMVGICKKVRVRMAWAEDWCPDPDACLPAFWKHLRVELAG